MGVIPDDCRVFWRAVLYDAFYRKVAASAPSQKQRVAAFSLTLRRPFKARKTSWWAVQVSKCDPRLVRCSPQVQPSAITSSIDISHEEFR